MKKKEFIDSLKKKTISALLELLRQGQTGELKIDPDYLQAVINELNERKLSEEENLEFENLLNAWFDETEGAEQDNEKFTSEEINKISADPDSRDKEPRKYTALKTVVGYIALLGYIVVVVGIGAFIYLISNKQIFIGFVAFVISIIIALPFLAFTNLVYVFIDIEYNTRQTKGILEKMLKRNETVS